MLEKNIHFSLGAPPGVSNFLVAKRSSLSEEDKTSPESQRPDASPEGLGGHVAGPRLQEPGHQVAPRAFPFDLLSRQQPRRHGNIQVTRPATFYHLSARAADFWVLRPSPTPRPGS